MTAGDDSRSTSSWLRPELWIALCVVPLLIWMLLPQHPRCAGLYHDDGSYVELGKSLLRRGVYRDGHLPTPIETAKYPPGVPLLAAGAQALTSDLSGALSAIRCVNLLFLVLGLAAFWGILRHEGLQRAAPALVFAIGWGAAVLDFVRVCMSEIPYLGLSLFAIYLLLRAEPRAERPWRDATLLAAVCFLACLTRSLGLVLVIAVCAHLVFVRRTSTNRGNRIRV